MKEDADGSPFGRLVDLKPNIANHKTNDAISREIMKIGKISKSMLNRKSFVDDFCGAALYKLYDVALFFCICKKSCLLIKSLKLIAELK